MRRVRCYCGTPFGNSFCRNSLSAAMGLEAVNPLLPLLIEIITVEHPGISLSSTSLAFLHKDYTSRCVPASSPHEPASVHPADFSLLSLCGCTAIFHSRWHAARWHRLTRASQSLSHRAEWPHQRDLGDTASEHPTQAVRVGHHHARIRGRARPHQHDRAW